MTIQHQFIFTGKEGKNEDKKNICRVLLTATMLVNLCAFSVHAEEPENIIMNETYENYPTGTVPTGKLTPESPATGLAGPVYCNTHAEVVEDGAGNKALLFHADKDTSQMWKIINTVPDNFVVSLDIKLKDAGVKNVSLGLNTSNGGYGEADNNCN